MTIHDSPEQGLVRDEPVGVQVDDLVPHVEGVEDVAELVLSIIAVLHGDDVHAAHRFHVLDVLNVALVECVDDSEESAIDELYSSDLLHRSLREVGLMLGLTHSKLSSTPDRARYFHTMPAMKNLTLRAHRAR